MKFFEKFEIKITTVKNIPVENLIVLITILANRKNNYSLGFLKTDNEGKIVVYRSEIEIVIEEAMSDFIMDYASDINDCRDWITIEVENLSELENRLERIEKFYPEDAKKLSKLMKICSNKYYKTINIDHKIEPEIVITVENI